MGAEALKKALEGPAVAAQLKENIRAWQLISMSGNNSAMPQTIIKDQVMFGPPRSAADVQAALSQVLQLR